MTDMGLHIDDLQLLQIKPVDPNVLDQLAAPFEEKLREDAEQIKLETRERMGARELESEAALDKKKITSELDGDAYEVRKKLELEEEQTRLLAAREKLKIQQLQHEKQVALIELEHQNELQEKARTMTFTQELAKEKDRIALDKIRQEADEAKDTKDGEKILRRAKINRDALLIELEAEAQKPADLRRHELDNFLIEKFSNAFAALPLKDARWLTIGNDDPLANMAGLFTGLRSAVTAFGHTKKEKISTSDPGKIANTGV